MNNGVRCAWIPAVALFAIGCGAGGDPPSTVAYDLPATATSATLSVTSDAVSEGGIIPKDFSAQGLKKPPKIQWTAVPKGTRAIAILIEDPDAPGKEPFVHLIGVVDAALTEADLNGQEGSPPETGLNSGGATGYYPLDPPPGSPHHYHFEVFAIDKPFVAPPDRAGLLSTIAGHVLAKGEVVGTYGL